MAGEPHDAVDAMVAAWQRELPSLDTSPLHVMSRLSRLARLLDRARKEAFSTHDLEVWEFDVISTLRREGEPYQLSPGALVAATLSTSGTMTHRIDRLEARGLVVRTPDASDRRSVHVGLTAQGKSLADLALTELVRREEALLQALTPPQRDELASLLRTLTSSIEP